MKNLGIYIHIPFCVSKCAYCDFYSLPDSKTSSVLKENYTEALCRQMEKCKSNYSAAGVSTVFIGGGTPTSLRTEQLLKITDSLKNSFRITPDAEFTVEANPATFDRTKLLSLKDAGVNRLSIGVQSAGVEELRLLRRIHSFKQAKESFELARSCGFENINLDLMYGIPSQTKESFLYTLGKTIELNPEHISVYGLHLEEGTPLSENRNSYVFPTEDEEADMFSEALKILKNSGYERYEISNFAKPGFYCKHNLGYWQSKEYLGFGPGAHSYYGGKRFRCAKDVYAFCLAEDFSSLITVEETLDEAEKLREYLMLSLRLCEGISLRELKERTRKPDLFLDRCKNYIDTGFMESKNGRLYFTEKGFDVSNTILSEILF